MLKVFQKYLDRGFCKLFVEVQSCRSISHRTIPEQYISQAKGAVEIWSVPQCRLYSFVLVCKQLNCHFFTVILRQPIFLFNTYSFANKVFTETKIDTKTTYSMFRNTSVSVISISLQCTPQPSFLHLPSSKSAVQHRVKN